jgi:hypothetical protein
LFGRGNSVALQVFLLPNDEMDPRKPTVEQIGMKKWSKLINSSVASCDIDEQMSH